MQSCIVLLVVRAWIIRQLDSFSMQIGCFFSEDMIKIHLKISYYPLFLLPFIFFFRGTSFWFQGLLVIPHIIEKHGQI